MSTNFYLRKKVTREQKDAMIRAINQERWDDVTDNIPREIHIGKRSGGWKFLWNANDFKYYSPSVKSLHEFLQSGNIYDEYGRSYTYDEFINNEVSFSGDDLETYYQHSNEYRPIISWDRRQRYESEHGVKVNEYGEFYIDKYRFTTWTEFC